MQTDKFKYTSFDNQAKIKKLEERLGTSKRDVMISLLVTSLFIFASIYYLQLWIQEEKLAHTLPINTNYGIFFIALLFMVNYAVINTLQRYKTQQAHNTSLNNFINALKYEVGMPNGEVLYYDNIDEKSVKGAYNILDAYAKLLQDTTIKPNSAFQFKASLLPFPKEKIRMAGRTIINTKIEKEQQYDIERSLLFLNDYIPDEEFEDTHV